MTMDSGEMRRVLLYHNKHGFEADLRDLNDRIRDLRSSNSEISALSFSLAVPSNRNNASAVEIFVMKDATVHDLQVRALDLERFIRKLDSAIATLPEKERKVVQLRYFNDKYIALDFFSIASELNYSVDWCEMLNKRALNILAQELNGARVTWED